MPRTLKPTKPAAAVVVATLLASLGATAGPAAASSHRDAPRTAADPQVDGVDLYAFVSPDKPDTVTFISTWSPFQAPAGGPTFYPFADGARYDLNIDNDGDAEADVIYRWTFHSHYRDKGTFRHTTGTVTDIDDQDLNFRQRYDLQRISGGSSTTLLDDAPVAPANVGAASMPDYRRLRRQAVRQAGSPRRLSFAGQADDPAFIDLRVFDLLYGGDLSEVGNDSVAGYNVNAIALQVPTAEVVGAGPVIGVWATAQRRAPVTAGAPITAGGDGTGVGKGDGWAQVSRVGNPLVNSLVTPVGIKDLFNASAPEDDARFLPLVTAPELPRLIEAGYRIPAPPAPRHDLVSVFLTGIAGLNRPADVVPSEMLRLNTGIGPSRDGRRLGMIDGDTAGFPNGRRLGDDVVDIGLQLIEGELMGMRSDIGDGVDGPDKPFEPAFPYLALPHAGSGAGPNLPQGGVAAGTAGTAAGAADGAPLPAAAAAGLVLSVAAAAGGTVLALARRRARPGA